MGLNEIPQADQRPSFDDRQHGLAEHGCGQLVYKRFPDQVLFQCERLEVGTDHDDVVRLHLMFCPQWYGLDRRGNMDGCTFQQKFLTRHGWSGDRDLWHGWNMLQLVGDLQKCVGRVAFVRQCLLLGPPFLLESIRPRTDVYKPSWTMKRFSFSASCCVCVSGRLRSSPCVWADVFEFSHAGTHEIDGAMRGVESDDLCAVKVDDSVWIVASACWPAARDLETLTT